MTIHKSLTKLEITESIVKCSGLKKEQALNLINSMLEEISNLLEKNINIKLSNFGQLKVKFKKERYGRNPKTKESAVISARKVVVFRANKTLKKKINSNLVGG